MLSSRLHRADLEGKRVFLRADLNVPLNNGEIVDDFRLESLRPTLDLLLEKKSCIILATHIGRPRNHEPSLSTRWLIPWFERNHYTILFHEKIEEPLVNHPDGTIVLLENLRFYSGEKKEDPEFAQVLAHYADYYVNDAFGALHRKDTSLTLLAYLFDATHRSIGLLVEKELQELSKLQKPEQPFVLILGGGKVSDKIPFIQAMLSKTHAILLGPAIVFTFLKAYGKLVGQSLIDENELETCRKIIEQAVNLGVIILMPNDFIIALNSFDGPVQKKPVDVDHFPHNAVGVTLGPNSAQLFAKEILKGKTIFYNGLMGDVKRPETVAMMRPILQAMTEVEGTTVVGGGDSVAAVRMLNLDKRIGFLSTGGGATLAYVSGKELPALEPFLSE